MTETLPETDNTDKNETPVRPARRIRKLSRALAGRLARYREILKAAQLENRPFVSSDSCGKELRVDGTLVRKDMASLGVVGKPHVGYPVADVLAALDRHMIDQARRAAVLVGAGNLGSAIVNAGVLECHGVHLEAVLDSDATKVGASLGRHSIRESRTLEECIERCGARLGVVAVPSDAAQSVIDRMTSAGIRVIWNFAPIRPQVPEGVRVLNERMSESVGRLSRYLDDAETVGRTDQTANSNQSSSSV